MTYQTGQKFKCNIQGTPVEGKILIRGDKIHLCNNGKYMKRDYDTLGYAGSWFFKEGNIYSMAWFKITDLEIIPDTSEPVKGDLVEVSRNGKTYFEGLEEYTGFKTNSGQYWTYSEGTMSPWNFIRKAPTKAQTDRQDAEREAREFCHNYEINTKPVDRSPLGILIEYIYKLKTEGK